MSASDERQRITEYAEREGVRREIAIDASPDEVWESLATEEGRDRWLEQDPQREIRIEVADEPRRLVWWWWSGDEVATRVEFRVIAVSTGSRVIVTETRPRLPLAALARAFALAAV
jgi:uncharacterized protein YndB with AHSA1/START domain